MTYVLGIDPGDTTGICGLEVLPNRAAVAFRVEEIPNGIDGFLEFWFSFRDEGEIIVCESFSLDGRTPKPDLTPVEIIGALKALVLPNPPGRLVFQTNTQGKHLMTNEVLKRAGYYPPRGQVKGGHGVDGLRHALTYVVKTLKHRPTIELLFPKEES